MSVAARAWAIAVLGAALLVAPEAAHACPVCFSGGDENRFAFTITTVFMTALPLVMIAGVLLWLRSVMLQSDRSRKRSPLETGSVEST